MKTILVLSVAVCVAAALSAMALADVVVLNNGQVFTGKISPAAGGSLKLTTEYGDQFFPKSEVAGYFPTPQGMEAEGYYQAGQLLINKGKRDAARQFFEACVKYDASYRAKCEAALKAAPPAVASTLPAATVPAAVAPPQPQSTASRIQCPGCQGSGVVMGASSVKSTRGTQRPRPCPLCGGKGYRVLEVPEGYEVCSDCQGFGATMGSSGGSERSGFTSTKTICPRCAGRGIIKSPFKAPEGTPGTESSGAVMLAASPSPSPGTPPSRPMSAIERAKSVASGGPAGRPISRPVGPTMVRPVSPTMLAETTPPEETKEEVVEERPSGTASSTATEETPKKAEKEDESDTGEYTAPGLVGWLKTHRMHVVFGGVGLMVFAVAFNKIKAKKAAARSRR